MRKYTVYYCLYKMTMIFLECKESEDECEEELGEEHEENDAEGEC